MAIDRYTVEERYTKRTLKRGFTVLANLSQLWRDPVQPVRAPASPLCARSGTHAISLIIS